MKKSYYVSEIKVFGKDSHGDNIVIKPFEKLQIVDENENLCVVKKFGKGQSRRYIINRKELFES